MTAAAAFPIQRWGIPCRSRPYRGERCSETAERTGNVDIIKVGMNRHAGGVDPRRNFSDMPKLCHHDESLHRYGASTRRSPYCGSLCIGSLLRFPSGMRSQRHALDRGESTGYLDRSVICRSIRPISGRNYDADVIPHQQPVWKGQLSAIFWRRNTA